MKTPETAAFYTAALIWTDRNDPTRFQKAGRMESVGVAFT